MSPNPSQSLARRLRAAGHPLPETAQKVRRITQAGSAASAAGAWSWHFDSLSGEDREVWRWGSQYAVGEFLRCPALTVETNSHGQRTILPAAEEAAQVGK